MTEICRILERVGRKEAKKNHRQTFQRRPVCVCVDRVAGQTGQTTKQDWEVIEFHRLFSVRLRDLPIWVIG